MAIKHVMKILPYFVREKFNYFKTSKALKKVSNSGTGMGSKVKGTKLYVSASYGSTPIQFKDAAANHAN